MVAVVFFFGVRVPRFTGVVVAVVLAVGFYNRFGGCGGRLVFATGEGEEAESENDGGQDLHGVAFSNG
jgi:hypothetical protein